MITEIFPKLVNLISFTAMGFAILLIVRHSLAGQVRIFAAQSVSLAILAVIVAAFTQHLELFGVAILFLLVKAIFIPRVLYRVVTQIGLAPVASPYLGTPIALSICGLFIVISFYVMGPIAASNPLPTAGAMPLAFAGVLIGLFITVNRRRALTQILGFLMLENSIFLFALLASFGVPFIVELGIFLDVLVAVLIMEVFVYRIQKNFDTHDVGQMGELKG